MWGSPKIIHFHWIFHSQATYPLVSVYIINIRATVQSPRNNMDLSIIYLYAIKKLGLHSWMVYDVINQHDSNGFSTSTIQLLG